ncbi:hypothetical protein [Streptomyces cupreus]|uniref:Uncharacterized protein n=1 Tax=Streptomyces cupreus TaxID=2759956 RepID=A0A7X1JFH9_9ACTN|nr:hypothetical protein [Streptomyces cupreus]MBC2907092.1 hypothetical protein [Streptomyces cupreus]
MSGVLDELAAAAAGVLVSSMSSDDWEERAKPTFVHIYGMAMKEDVGPTLDSFRRDLRSGTLSAREASQIWKSKIREAFKKGVIANEVHQFIEDFRPVAFACPFCEARMEGGDTFCGACGHDLGAPAPAPVSVRLSVPQDHVVPEDQFTSPRFLPQDHVDFREANFNAPVIGVQNNHYAAAAPASADGWPRFTELRRPTLGVRPVSSFGDEPALPPYIPRDRDADLDRLVDQGLREGALVVVTGEPLAGKTATAWAALNRNADHHTRLFSAHPGTDLRELPAALRGRDPSGTYVVWLDDLEGHLDERGLVAGPLTQLTHEGVLVLATMRDAAYEAHRFGDHPTARVLRGARTVDLTCDWSEAELARLAQAGDPRLGGAAQWRGELGVTQFLSVGPELWEEWRRASRPGGRSNGHLLVSAAIDAARCGVTSALSPETWEYLINVRTLYGTERVLDGPVSKEDLQWATRPRLGVCGLLVPGAQEGTWRASGTLVADASRSPDLPPLSAHLWGSVAQLAAERDLPERNEVMGAARAAVRTRAEADHPGAKLILAILSTWALDDPEARRWWRKVEEEDPSLAFFFGRYLFLEQDELAEAVPHMETAIGAGYADLEEELGFLLLTRAMLWLGKAAAVNGSPAAAEVVPAIQAALRDDRFEAVLTQHYPPPQEQPPLPGPPLSPQRTIRLAVDIMLGRRPARALEENPETPPDTVKE